jgi:alpha-glucosidase
MPDWFRDYTVDRQSAIPDSTLNLYRQALRIRRDLQDTTETMEWVGAPSNDVLHFARPGGWQVVTNMGAEDGVALPEGDVLLLSDELVDGRLPIDATAWLRVQ